MTDINPYRPPDADLNVEQTDVNPYCDIELPASPWSLAGLKLLFFKPEHFFSSKDWLMKQPYLLITTYLSGLAYAIGQIDNRLVKYDLKGETTALVHSVVNSWSYYWAFVIGVGLLGALLIWVVAGWWYRVRLNWSGDKEADPKEARTAYVYQDMVMTIPSILMSVIFVFVFDNYMDYWQSEEIYSTSILFFIFWSCYISYKAALSFNVDIYKARIWFLILPSVFYALVMGLVVAALSYVS